MMNAADKVSVAWHMGARGFSRHAAESVIRFAPAVRRHMENACSLEGYDCEAGEKRLLARSRKLELPPGWKVKLQGDPRGCVLMLVNGSGEEIRVH